MKNINQTRSIRISYNGAFRRIFAISNNENENENENLKWDRFRASVDKLAEENLETSVFFAKVTEFLQKFEFSEIRE